MKFLGYDRVLCLSPHPDDVEYSMSATILKHKDTKFDVFTLTNGTSADDSSGDWRYDEVRSFWDDMLVSNVKLIFGNHSFEGLNEGQWIGYIEDKFKGIEYDAIFATSNLDSHYEHLLVNRLMIGMGRNKPLSLIEYKSPSTLHEWKPNLFVNINHYYEFKGKLLRDNFNTQTDAIYFSKECIKLFHEDYINKKKGIDYVESFNVKSMVIK